MKSMIENYRNIPGKHCGSTAMRNLIWHYCGIDLSEEVVFGLAAGIECGLLTIPNMNPGTMISGRSFTLETNLARTLDIEYEEQREDDDDEAWEKVRQEIIDGRPTMLSGDIFYLDYREFKHNFPGHRFVLLGFDDEKEEVYLADRINDYAETCSYQAVRKSRNPPQGISTNNLWGRFSGSSYNANLEEACVKALDLCTECMLSPELPEDFQSAGVVTGIAGIRKLGQVIPTWQEDEQASQLASFNALCIEKFGNGGGAFRNLYAGFLEWAHETTPDLVEAHMAPAMFDIAARWTELSDHLFKVSESPHDKPTWKQAGTLALDIADAEERLLSRIRENLAQAS
jgi:hypothetical protein